MRVDVAVAEGEFVTRREFEGTTKYISEKLDRIESKADSIHDELLDEIKGTREELKNEFNKRFDTLESRLDKLEGRFDALEGRFDALEGRFDKVDAALQQLLARDGR